MILLGHLQIGDSNLSLYKKKEENSYRLSLEIGATLPAEELTAEKLKLPPQHELEVFVMCSEGHSRSSFESLVSLDLEGVNIVKFIFSFPKILDLTRDEHVRNFIEKHNQRLRALSFPNYLEYGVGPHLSSYLPICEKIEELSFESCSIGSIEEKEADAIKEIFDKFPSLKKLDLSNCGINDAGFEALANALDSTGPKNPTLEELIIGFYRVKSAEKMAESILQNQNLRTLSLKDDLPPDQILKIMRSAYINNEVRKHFGKKEMLSIGYGTPDKYVNISPLDWIQKYVRTEKGELDEVVKILIEEQMKMKDGVGMEVDEQAAAAASANVPPTTTSRRDGQRSGAPLAEKEPDKKVARI